LSRTIVLKRSSEKKIEKEIIMDDMGIKIFMVEGMSCKNCKAHVERSVKTIDGVVDAIADLASGQVKVTGTKIDPTKVKEMVEEAGYFFKGEAYPDPEF
jgi:copper chaperone CopZ